jgi:cytochrome c5
MGELGGAAQRTADPSPVAGSARVGEDPMAYRSAGPVGKSARSFNASCPQCAQPMEPGMLGTNGKLAWEPRTGRLSLAGESVGAKVIAKIQNYQAWRCPACQLLLFDYSHVL